MPTRFARPALIRIRPAVSAKIFTEVSATLGAVLQRCLRDLCGVARRRAASGPHAGLPPAPRRRSSGRGRRAGAKGWHEAATPLGARHRSSSPTHRHHSALILRRFRRHRLAARLPRFPLALQLCLHLGQPPKPRRHLALRLHVFIPVASRTRQQRNG